MNDFLTSNEWQWRLLHTIAQGVLGVVAAGLLCLVLLPLYPLCWVVDRFENEFRD